MARGFSTTRRGRRHAPTTGPDLVEGSAHAHVAVPASIASAPDRERVRLTGQLRTVTLRPRGGVPALEAELHDGTGGVALVWLGRRRIAGITPGRSLAVEGRIGRSEKARVLYNPRYELLP